MTRRRPLIRNPRAELTLGVLVAFAGFYLVWEATDRRGIRKPRWLGPFIPT